MSPSRRATAPARPDPAAWPADRRNERNTLSAAPLVVIGGGLAAASAVRALRKASYDGDLVVYTSEAHHPYERPPLTKDYLRGESDRGSMFTPAEDWYADNDVDVRTGATVVGIDPGAHRITLADGGASGYRRLLLATGSSPRALSVPGSDLRGVLTLRTVDDADLLRASLASAARDGDGRLVVIGDGWIGMEVAASARMLGLDVTVLGRGRVPLAKVLGEEVGGVYADLHRAHGVRLRGGVHIERIVGSDHRVTGVELGDGQIVPADVVVAGIGAVPNVGLAVAAGLDLRRPEVGGGIAVGGTLVTSHPDIFAAGDIASVPSQRWRRPIRVEHWATALRTGPHAARAMLGSDAVYERLPYFYSDQFDSSMEYSGFVDARDGFDRFVVSGDLGARVFAGFWVKDDVVQAGMTMNVPDRIGDIEALIAAGAPVADDPPPALTL